VPDAEEELRGRLGSLARAAGLPMPKLTIEADPTGRKLPTRVRRGGGGEPQIHASSQLLTKTPQEQMWHLASALGWWASPVPRRRRVLAVAVSAAVLVLHLGIGLAELDGSVHLPRVALALLGPLGLFVTVSYQGLTRRERRSSDIAGHSVLAASGYSPATLARQVFGGQPDPPWHKQVFHAEPAPSRRITDAAEWQPQPFRALH
jgi:hypothetical protein